MSILEPADIRSSLRSATIGSTSAAREPAPSWPRPPLRAAAPSPLRRRADPRRSLGRAATRARAPPPQRPHPRSRRRPPLAGSPAPAPAAARHRRVPRSCCSFSKLEPRAASGHQGRPARFSEQISLHRREGGRNWIQAPPPSRRLCVRPRASGVTAHGDREGAARSSLGSAEAARAALR